MDTKNWPQSLCGLDIDEFLARAEMLHGHISPGVVMGGFLVDAAHRLLGPSQYRNVVVETVVCLPDAVQVLTACTLGNGFLQVLDWGKFALTMYDRMTLRGVRAWPDPAKLPSAPSVEDWFLRSEAGSKIDKGVVVGELLSTGSGLAAVTPVRLFSSLRHSEKVLTQLCPSCGETFPRRLGSLCPACAGQSYYSPLMDS